MTLTHVRAYIVGHGERRSPRGRDQPKAAVDIVEQAARERKDIAEDPNAKLIFASFDGALSDAAKRHGRHPTAAETHLELERSRRMPGLTLEGFDWLIKCRLLNETASIRAADLRRSAKPRAAERYVNFSLHFMPRGQRERYRQEWEAEMTALVPAEADRFARGVLRTAVKSGLSLRVRELFGRMAA
ncbi:hypothetical protein ABZ069_35480 [Streptomyces microflavus]|uniref:hypothetical protein n=1 Tax=Streptomyces microflavus TaxID=1919 RepID=UPI0033AC86A6